MQLHELHIGKQKNKRPRVGRGGKRGTTSGRGQKGQRSRSGHRIRPAERDFIQRLPKLRGFKNRSERPRPFIITFAELAGIPKNQIDQKTLQKAGVVHRLKKGESVKLLGSGHLNRPLTIRGITVSEEAKKKIEAAGGKVQ